MPEEYKVQRLDYSQELRMKVYWPKPHKNGTEAADEDVAHIFKLCRDTGWMKADNYPGSSQDAFYVQELGALHIPEEAVQQILDSYSFNRP